MKRNYLVKKGHEFEVCVVDNLLTCLRSFSEVTDVKLYGCYWAKIDAYLGLLEDFELISLESYLSFQEDVYRKNFEQLKKWIKDYFTEIAPSYADDSFLDI